MQKKKLKELAKYNKEQVKLRKEEAKRKDWHEGLGIAPESIYGPVYELERDWMFNNLGSITAFKTQETANTEDT